MGYKAGDKVVVEVTLKAESCDRKSPYRVGYDCDNGHSSYIGNDDILGKLEDFKPVQEKIKMTVEEKKELDELRDDSRLSLNKTAYEIMQTIFKTNDYLLIQSKVSGTFEQQLKLLECIEHPELIEVVHEDVRTVKVAGLYLWKYAGEYKLVADFDIRNENYYFTKSEIERVDKFEKFNNVDLVAAWEDGE